MPEVIPIFELVDYDAQIARGAEALRQGRIVVLPTETVYGGAGLLTQPQGLARLRELRGSGAEAKPFTIHLARPGDVDRYISPPSELGRRMIQKLWPGPVALVFDVPAERRAEVAAELKLAEGDLFAQSQITLRCPDHIVASEVISQAAGPVALTLVGSNDWSELAGKADLVFDAGPSTYSKPSTIVHVMGDRYEIVREGVYDQRIIERLLHTTVLFVCSGNTCRSPMAEALTRRLIAKNLQITEDELENKGIAVISAGSFAMPGSRAAVPAVAALRDLGIDLTRHRSRPLSVELIHQADWIFTMSRSHAAAVVSLVPSAREKTTNLSPDGDIEDPIGGDVALYQSLAKQLNDLIEKQVITRVLAGR